MACIEGRVKHSYQGGGNKCVHCGEPNPSEGSSAASGGAVGESLTDLQQEGAGKAALKESKRTRKKAVQAEDEKKLSETRSIRAQTMARMPSQGMRTLASIKYGYHGKAFDLLESQLSELASCYETTAEAFGWEFAGKWMSLMFLTYVQGQICVEQWTTMLADTSVVRENAATK